MTMTTKLPDPFITIVDDDTKQLVGYGTLSANAADDEITVVAYDIAIENEATYSNADRMLARKHALENLSEDVFTNNEERIELAKKIMSETPDKVSTAFKMLSLVPGTNPANDYDQVVSTHEPNWGIGRTVTGEPLILINLKN
jgi:hypothetical protein